MYYHASQFKGEAPKKKRRKTAKLDGGDGAAVEEEATIDGWIAVPSASLALGPTYLTLPSTSLTPTAVCLALQPTTGKVYAHPLQSSASLAATASVDLGLDAEDLAAVVEGDPAADGPTDVNHVWVCTRIPDSDTGVTFRSGSGKFLAVDELGVVSAEREARGSQEEFTVEDAQNGSGIVVKSSYGKYLSVDVLAGGKLELRADETTEGETERWRPYMQGEFLPKAKKALMERSGIKATVSGRGSGDSAFATVGDVTQVEKELM